MRILFAALHNGYYRNLDSVVEELARRGHEIHLGAEREDSSFGGQPIVERLTAAHATVTSGRIALREPETLFLPAKVRFAIDYLRYLEPVYPTSSGLSLRARARTPTGMLRLAQSPLLAWRPIRRLVSRGLDAVERAVPASPDIERFLDQQRPDLIVITPLVGLVVSSQIDLLRSALRRGIATAVMVWSWDHLSSKALIRDIPDALFVWNDVQKREAMHMHRCPGGSHHRHRRAVLRPLVRTRAHTVADGIRAPCRSARRTAVRVVGLLGAAPRNTAGAARLHAVGVADSALERSAPEGCSDSAASPPLANG